MIKQELKQKRRGEIIYDPLFLVNKVVVLKLQELSHKIYVEELVRYYIIIITRATRCHESIKLGADPRDFLDLYHGSRAPEAIQGRNYLTPDDVKHLSVPALAYRIILKTEYG